MTSAPRAHPRVGPDDERGFTLIEILVVILIIGILAAIALPAFLTKRDSAKDAGAKSVARNAVTQMESCLAGPGVSVAACAADPQVTAVGGTSLTVTPQDPGYVITVTSASGGDFSIAKPTDDSRFVRSCGAVKITQGCKTGSTW